MFEQSYNNWSLTAQMKLSIYEQMPVDRGRRRLYEHSGISREDDHSSDNKVASEFIESHVIVDLDEAFKANPDWRPHFYRPHMSITETPESMFDDEWPIQVWSGKSRSKLMFSIPEAIQIRDGIELRQRYDNLRNVDTFLRYRAEGATRWARLGQQLDKLR